MVAIRLRDFVVVAILGLALPAHAAPQLEPGLWQDTETPVENGKPGTPEVNTTCLSPDEARDPVKTIMKDSEGEKCDTLKVRQTGNTVVVEMKCGDPKTTWMAIDMTINFADTRHYSGHVKSQVIFKGQKIDQESMIDSKWLAAACKK